MTTLLVIRHGQSTSNIKGVFTGHLDLPLTELGLQQAAVTAEYILSNYSVNGVYSSDLCRAVATGQAVADPLGLPVYTDHRLREIWAGNWEGRSFDELSDVFPAYAVWKNDIGNCVTDGGESVQALSERVLEAFHEIARKHPGQTVVIATHATPIRALQCHCEGKPVSMMRQVPWVTNASVTAVSYDNGSFSLLDVCHDSHLGDIVSRFPANV